MKSQVDPQSLPASLALQLFGFFLLLCIVRFAEQYFSTSACDNTPIIAFLMSR